MIGKEQLQIIKSYISRLNWVTQYMGEDDKYDFYEFKNYLKELENKLKEPLKVYVITNNAVVDDEICYNIAGVALDKKDAQKLFEQTIKDVKCDADFEHLNAIDMNDDSKNKYLQEWYYDKDDDSFELYLNGEYNSNNYEVRMIEYHLFLEKERPNQKGMER